MKTPSQTSPYNYFQERYRADKWRLLVCVMMLNQTNGKQVEQVHLAFFQSYPDPLSASQADPEEMSKALKPLGFQNRRARQIIAMSRAYLIGGWKEPSELPGIGQYGQDSWDIFVKGELKEDVADKELRRYVAWAKGLGHG